MRVVATKIRSFSATPRVPSIKFIGKRSLAGAHASSDSNKSHSIASSSPPAAPAKTAAKPVEKKAGSGVDMITLKDGAWHGRPKLSKVRFLFYHRSLDIKRLLIYHIFANLNEIFNFRILYIILPF
jgi:hypothetical protein